jgi:hypothetical protein
LGAIAIAVAACAAGPAGSAPATGPQAESPAQASSPADRPTVRDLVTIFTRSGVGPDQVEIDLTYAPPLFFEATGLRPPPELGVRPTLAFMLQETVHDGALSGQPAAVLLLLDSGARVDPFDITVTASDPHHRTTRLLFPDPDGASASAPTDGPGLTVRLVVPFADGAVSAANTFEWRLPIELEPGGPIGASR